MLEIQANKTILIDGDKVEVSVVDMRKLLVGCLDMEVKIDENLKLKDLIHVFYELKEFINEFFIEEYEAVRALISMGRLVSFAENIQVMKNIELSSDDEQLGGVCRINTTSQIKYQETPKVGATINVGDLTIEMHEDLKDVDEILNKDVKIKFTLIDILNVIFDDLIYTLRNEPVMQ